LTIVRLPGTANELRVTTDQRDPERLVRLLMIDALHPVRVPSGEEQALRDLVRAREDPRGDLMDARHRLSKLRHDVRAGEPRYEMAITGLRQQS
jgi:transposase